MENNRIYLPLQIKALLPAEAYKVIDLLTVFQKEDGTVSYSKRNAEFLHMDEVICEQAVQTAIDIKLFLPVGVDGGVYRFKLNTDVIKRAQEVSLKDIPEKKMINLSGNITFKTRMKNGIEEPKGGIDDMSYDEMKKMLIQISARMKEHEQVKKMVVNDSDYCSDLPF